MHHNRFSGLYYETVNHNEQQRIKFLFCTCKSRSLTESAQYYEVVVLDYVPYSACAWVAKLNVSFIKYDENWQVQKPIQRRRR